MKLQKETKKEPPKSARLNRLVFGVALLWLATSVLLLLMYHSSPAHAVQPNRASQQKLALVARPAHDMRPDKASQAHKLALVASRSITRPSYIF